MGRATSGVRGIQLGDDDRVVALSIVEAGATLLVASENGIGKRTTFEEYRQQSRGGKGIITMKTGDKTGGIIGALSVHDHDEIMLITVGGQMIRIAVDDIREAGRNTMGVKLVDTKGVDRLQAIAPVINEEEDDSDSEADQEESGEQSENNT
jgi:DNA gyrase subunit A